MMLGEELGAEMILWLVVISSDCLLSKDKHKAKKKAIFTALQRHDKT